MKRNSLNIHKITVCGILGAVSTVLMFSSFNVPLMPSFIKLDFSELPALLAAYSYGPLAGVAVCAVKNIINVFATTTGAVGELSNFLLGSMFVIPAGLIYSRFKSKKGAFAGAMVGAVTMAVASIFFNYYIVYPVYTLFMPMEECYSAGKQSVAGPCDFQYAIHICKRYAESYAGYVDL